MKIDKLTEASCLEEVECFFKERNLTRGVVSQKIKYFEDNNVNKRYDALLGWLSDVERSLPSKVKISPEKARTYLKKYGGTKAVKVLLDEGITITRQGLYKAVKEKDNE